MKKNENHTFRFSSLKNSPGANFRANPVRGEAQGGAEQNVRDDFFRV